MSTIALLRHTPPHQFCILLGVLVSMAACSAADDSFLQSGGTTGGSGAGVGGALAQAGASGAASPMRVAATVTPSPDGTCKFPAGYTESGSLTWYLFSQGSTEVNCSYPILGTNPDVVEFVPYGSGQYFAAINTADYAAAAMCGACVEVTRDTGNAVRATVVDQCPVATNPKCTAGHLDLSKAAFLQLGVESEGYLGKGNGAAAGIISWRYVPCDTPGNLVIRLKEPNNRYWNEFLVENHRNPIAKFELLAGTEWLAGVRTSYNYWSVNNGKVGLPKSIRITDIHGSVVEATIDYPPSGLSTLELNAQFPTCQ
jgi:expansin (peptidoglycan-binding protein)